MVSLGSTRWRVEDHDFSFLLFHVSMDQHLSHPIRILEKVACWRASFIHGSFYRTCFSSVSCSWKWLAMTRCFFSCSFFGGDPGFWSMHINKPSETRSIPIPPDTKYVHCWVPNICLSRCKPRFMEVLGFLRGWKIHRNPSGFHMISSTLTDMHGSPQSICH